MTDADADDAREHVEKLTGNNLVTFADKGPGLGAQELHGFYRDCI